MFLLQLFMTIANNRMSSPQCAKSEGMFLFSQYVRSECRAKEWSPSMHFLYGPPRNEGDTAIACVWVGERLSAPN